MTQNEADYGIGLLEPREPMVFVYDIECTGLLGYSYGMWETNIHKVMEYPILLSFAYTWYDISRANDPTYKPKIICRTLADTDTYEVNPKDDTLLIKELYALRNQADVLIGHNSKQFDDKVSNMFFMKYNNLNPPVPVQQLDTKIMAKQIGRFPSNSLNQLADFFGIGHKTETTHADLWFDSITGGKDGRKAMKKMAVYNKQDVNLTIGVYQRLKPWYRTPVNFARIANLELACPNCLKSNYHQEGTRPTKTGRYQRYQCNECFHWFSDRSAVREKDGDIKPAFVSA